MNRSEREHLNSVAELGCLACRKNGYSDSPAQIHHIRKGVGKGQRQSHYHAIPLCHIHHQSGGHGVAIHAGTRTFESVYGTEIELLQLTYELIGREVDVVWNGQTVEILD